MEEEPPSSLLPRVVLFLVGVLVVLTVVGWVIGAILGALRFIAFVGICVAIIWAIASARSER